MAQRAGHSEHYPLPLPRREHEAVARKLEMTHKALHHVRRLLQHDAIEGDLLRLRHEQSSLRLRWSSRCPVHGESLLRPIGAEVIRLIGTEGCKTQTHVAGAWN